jgi:SAM-dependent methyltransferase
MIGKHTESSMSDGILGNDEGSLITIRSRYERAAEYIEKIAGGTVLDIGCSVGYGSDILHSHGLSVTGIDRNRDSIMTAVKKYPSIRFKVADASSYRKGSYDAIVALEVLEHLDDCRNAVRNWLAMLKEGGVLIISTPNVKYSKNRNPFHKKEFSLDELKEKFPGSKIEGFDFHYVTTKPITLLVGGNWALKFRMFLNIFARHFPGYCNSFFLVFRKWSHEPSEHTSQKV